MKFFGKEILVTGVALLGFLSLNGCASKTDVEIARVLAEEAQANAIEAIECCYQNTVKMDRMYQKIMTK